MPQPPDERQEVTNAQFMCIKAELGIDAETFRRTNVGRYIFDRLLNEEEDLIEDLITAALSSTDQAVMHIANQIQMRRMMPRFIDDAVRAGEVAEQELRQAEGAEPDY